MVKHYSFVLDDSSEHSKAKEFDLVYAKSKYSRKQKFFEAIVDKVIKGEVKL